jgi:DNA-binding winged helix-turn-helix (wHTH) protein
MQVPATASSRLRVGGFEVDLRCGEVRRNGDRIKLQERPFQILAALLERPGEMVTREEIQQKLWPTDTFVDFEHSINTAVTKLREALGDDAENPRFIETLPRRGYRLSAPVEIVEKGVLARKRRSHLCLHGRETSRGESRKNAGRWLQSPCS